MLIYQKISHKGRRGSQRQKKFCLGKEESLEWTAPSTLPLSDNSEPMYDLEKPQPLLHDIKQKLNCLSVGFRMGFHTLSKRMPNSCSIGA